MYSSILISFTLLSANITDHDVDVRGVVSTGHEVCRLPGQVGLGRVLAVSGGVRHQLVQEVDRQKPGGE